MNRMFRLSLLVTCLLQAACAVLPDKPVRADVYDFGPGARTDPVAATALSAPTAAIEIGEVEAPSAFDGTALLYRLAYTNAQLLQPYAQARWSMPPALLLQQRLREMLGQGQPVLRQGRGPFSGVASARLLQLELDEFSHVFDAPDSSVGLVRVHATVMAPSAGGGRRLLAQRSFVAQQPAPSPDAAGGVRALTAASDQLLSEIAQWLNTLR